MSDLTKKGVAASPIDLLQQLVDWLLLRGWTLNMSQSEGAGWRAHLSKNGIYVNLRAAMNESIGYVYYQNSGTGYGLAVNIGTGYDSSKFWRNQDGTGRYLGVPGEAVFVAMRLPSANITGYWFFDDGSDNIFVVCEATPGIFGYLGWGNIEKTGAWTGGLYMVGSRSPYYMFNLSYNSLGYTETSYCPFTFGGDQKHPCMYMRADVDTVSGLWLSLGTDTGWTQGSTHGSKFLYSPIYSGSYSEFPSPEIPNYANGYSQHPIQNRQYNIFNDQILFLPVHLYVGRDAGGKSLLGRIPTIRYCAAVANGVPAGSERAIGSDTFVLFPNFAVKKAA